MIDVRRFATRAATRLHVVFINYGEFGNNSGKHIEAFARGLTRRGHEVVVLAGGRPSARNSLAVSPCAWRTAIVPSCSAGFCRGAPLSFTRGRRARPCVALHST